MEVKKSNIRCFGCKNYRTYYSRAFCSLLMERFGYCEQHNNIVQESDYCDKWRKRRISCAQHTSIAIESINEIYQKIAIVEHMLKEEIAVEKLNKETTE